MYLDNLEIEDKITFWQLKHNIFIFLHLQRLVFYWDCFNDSSIIIILI